MKHLGRALIAIGIMFAFNAMMMDISVSTGYGRVNNLGLMNEQTNLLIIGGIIFISGIIFIGFSIKSNNESNNTNDENKKCPYCAEIIKKEAIICRFCQKDLPALNSDSVEEKDVIVNLRQLIIELRDKEGCSYQIIANDFNEKNVSIPKNYDKFKTWTSELVKLLYYNMLP